MRINKKLKYPGFGPQLGQIFLKAFTIWGIVAVLRQSKREKTKQKKYPGFGSQLRQFFLKDSIY
jgi:hypothetical protein